MRFPIRIVPLFFLLGLCVGSPSAECATENLERTTRRLSQALETYRGELHRQGGYDPVFHRDPMQVLVDSKGAIMSSAGLHDGLAVQGIIWSQAKPLVVIDDRLFAQGDTVGPYKIVTIRQDGIVVQNGDQSQEILLERGIQEKK